MDDRSLGPWQHPHDFLPPSAESAERRTWLVIGLTAVMMVLEIGAGALFNSMALLADGWHMASHAAALGITVFAYRFARRHRADPRFSFGTGKVGVLGGYSSAVVLAVIAVAMVYGSVERLLEPQRIAFDEALLVAVVGLGTNLVSAGILAGGRAAGHGHGHGHGGRDASGAGGTIAEQPGTRRALHDDHNLRAAYLHVMADALTSVLAIVALLCGRLWGWIWLDAVMGIVGALLILRWSRGLLRDTAGILLDRQDDPSMADWIRDVLQADGDCRVADLHVWRVSPSHAAAVVSLVVSEPRAPAHYRKVLARGSDLSHVTIEVHCSSASPPMSGGDTPTVSE